MRNERTVRAAFVFAVKEYSHGEPWIMLEKRGAGLNILGSGFLGLELKEGVSLEGANKLATLLQDLVETVSYTHVR